MNWKFLLLSVAVAIIPLSLSYFTILSLDIGIIMSVLALIPSFYSLLMKPKVSISIKNIELKPIKYNNRIGYRLMVDVTNNGKRLVSNLTAKFDIRDSKSNESISFIRVTIEKRDNHRKVTFSEEESRDDFYEWVGEGVKKEQTILPKLRYGDHFSLRYPREGKGFFIMLGTGESSSGYSILHDTLLKLEKRKYFIEIEVKGEDPEKNIVIKRKKIKRISP